MKRCVTTPVIFFIIVLSQYVRIATGNLEIKWNGFNNRNYIGQEDSERVVSK